jgi:hypothetical protein
LDAINSALDAIISALDAIISALDGILSQQPSEGLLPKCDEVLVTAF